MSPCESYLVRDIRQIVFNFAKFLYDYGCLQIVLMNPIIWYLGDPS